MEERFLEITYRQGKPFAAYYHLPRGSSEKSHRSERVHPGLVVDFNEAGHPIGIELIAPAQTADADVNGVLGRLGLAPATTEELAPLHAA